MFLLRVIIFLILLVVSLFFVLLVLNFFIKLIRFLFFRNIKPNLGDHLVEIVFEFGKRANDKALIGIIGETKKLISQNSDLLTLSYAWVDIIDYIRESQSKEGQLAFFQYIFKNTKFPNHEKLADYIVELINIRWFNPVNKPNKKILETLANECIKEFSQYTFNEDGRTKNYQIQSVEFIEDDWSNALAAYDNSVISSEYFKNGDDIKSKKEYLREIDDVIYGVIWGASPLNSPSDNTYLKCAIMVAEQLAKSIILKDSIKQNKIASYFLGMYKLGVWPMGVVEEKNAYKFTIFIPPSVNEKKDTSGKPLFITKALLVNKKMSESLGGGDIKKHILRFKWFIRPN